MCDFVSVYNVRIKWHRNYYKVKQVFAEHREKVVVC